jgi:hypothetical protein
MLCFARGWTSFRTEEGGFVHFVICGFVTEWADRVGFDRVHFDRYFNEGFGDICVVRRRSDDAVPRVDVVQISCCKAEGGIEEGPERGSARVDEAAKKKKNQAFRQDKWKRHILRCLRDLRYMNGNDYLRISKKSYERATALYNEEKSKVTKVVSELINIVL